MRYIILSTDTTVQTIFCCKSKPRLLTQAAKTLAHLHEVMADFVSEGKKLNRFMADGRRLWRNVDWALDVLEKFFQNWFCERVLKNAFEYLLNIKENIGSLLIENGRTNIIFLCS